MRPILAITSTKAYDLLKNGLVKLPADVDTDGVTYLLEYLHHLLFSTMPGYRMNSNHISIEQILSVTAAAVILGMEKYVNDVYKKCKAILHNQLLSYDDLTTITRSAEHHHRLFKIVVKNLAKRV
jgi:hypothetical protein